MNRKIWENEVKDAPAGKKFYRKITDDTMPGGLLNGLLNMSLPSTAATVKRTTKLHGSSLRRNTEGCNEKNRLTYSYTIDGK